MEGPDPNRLREVEIQRLARMAELAYENSMDQKLTMKMRESWHQRYTNTVLALNQLLKVVKPWWYYHSSRVPYPWPPPRSRTGY